jgi:hypothetical protein
MRQFANAVSGELPVEVRWMMLHRSDSKSTDISSSGADCLRCEQMFSMSDLCSTCDDSKYATTSDGNDIVQKTVVASQILILFLSLIDDLIDDLMSPGCM